MEQQFAPSNVRLRSLSEQSSNQQWAADSVLTPRNNENETKREPPSRERTRRAVESSGRRYADGEAT